MCTAPRIKQYDYNFSSGRHFKDQRIQFLYFTDEKNELRELLLSLSAINKIHE